MDTNYRFEQPQYSDYGIDNISFACIDLAGQKGGDEIPSLSKPVLEFSNSHSFAQPILVYPNPSNQFLNIQFEAALETAVEYELKDLLGRTLKEGQINHGETQHQIDVDRFSNSIYLLLIGNQKDGYRQERIIKQSK